MAELTCEAVETIFRDCLFKDDEVVDGKPVVEPIMVEGNYHHDNFWGDCYCKRCKDINGENHLGLLLMELRSKLRQQEKWCI